ncbi:hypothetical protein [Arthrobacter sp. StoSoilB5]|uniref:hypothetical protein n=1 Tax=Arthrobacter sp. StoSoilB5 TaxID=2830992 RepID=UPI001CC5CB40|nr:hypothetical protein [Arthrobacter sp. StoSoilB5]BCW46965.1 hypothetical protein StoSoilB5_41490 [Arthrobacter sp. StoSoilB5]
MTGHPNSNWACGLGAELLRHFSGYSVLGILAFSALVPWFVANFLGWPDTADQLSATENIKAFWALATSIAIVATFAGSYLVTRESYYGTLRRSVVMSGLVHLVAVKYAAALVVGLATLAAGILAWGASVAFTLPPELRVELLTPESWRALPGVVLSSAVGSLWGCSLGWIIRHYYATTIVTMLIPLAIELPVLANDPEIGRWLPSGALAGIASLPFEGLLQPGPAFLVSLAWLLAASAGVVGVLKRKEF